MAKYLAITYVQQVMLPSLLHIEDEISINVV